MSRPVFPQSVQADDANPSETEPQHQACAHPGVGTAKLRLANPFSNKKYRHIVKRTAQLMYRRDVLDKALLLEVEKLRHGPDDWPLREKLFQEQEDLESRECRHLRKTTRRLAETKILYLLDPTIEHARNYDIIRKLLWRFKRNLGPLLGLYHQREGGYIDDSESKLDETIHDIHRELKMGPNDFSAASRPNTTTVKEAHKASQNITGPRDPNGSARSKANKKQPRKRKWEENPKDGSSKKFKSSLFSDQEPAVCRKEGGKDKKEENQIKNKSNEADRTNDN
ncbi:hypothetical protein F5X96DRAFT_94876 [Biscogniauxia mediterranea]|nr:hypothetical protein F5X96DRAFT_94876 [Biscogniauxia mediterranea]